MIGNFISAYQRSNLTNKFEVAKDNEAPQKFRTIAAVNLAMKALCAVVLPFVLLGLLSSCQLGLSGRATPFQTAKNLAFDASALVVLHEIVVIADNVFSRELTLGGVAQQGWSAVRNGISGLWNGAERAEQNSQRDKLKAYTQDTLIAKHLVRLF